MNVFGPFFGTFSQGRFGHQMPKPSGCDYIAHMHVMTDDSSIRSAYGTYQTHDSTLNVRLSARNACVLHG